MGVPLIQSYRVGRYILAQKLRGRRRYPLVLMLEPLFRCNLACAGCGKIDYPDETLDRRLSVDECIGAAEECGAPIVSIAGGEPLIHKDMPAVVAGLVKRKRFVYLCTNALLLKKRMEDYQPSPYLTFSVHLDGNEHRHDESVCQPGTYQRAAEAIREAVAKGFRVTVNCTLFQGEGAEEVASFLDDCKALDVEGVTISPGFNYERAPQQEVFIQRRASRQLFRDIFRIGKERKAKWMFNQSSLFLDFLAGNQNYQCTPWGNPTRNIFGWQKPCYLLVSEGYAQSFNELMETTPWDKYGVGVNGKCDQCQVHSGFEPTAVNDTFIHPLRALKVALLGPRTEGPMAPDMPVSPPPQGPSHPVFPLRVER